MNKEIVIRWCGACHSWYIRCPQCGNNTCNAMYGEDGKCPVCPKAYDLQDALNKNKLSDMIDELFGREQEGN